jgi:hypothetical protein
MGYDFVEEYRSLVSQRLLEIATQDPANSEYRPEAIKAAQAELDYRGVNWQESGAEEPPPEATVFAWEEFRTIDGPHTLRCYRASLPGGWLVYACEGAIEGGDVFNYRLSPSITSGLTFVPDPDHEWDGGTNW